MRLYRALLHLYPRSFRAEYGEPMAVIFAERRRQTQGVFAILGLWIETIGDIVVNALGTHWEILMQDLRTTFRGLRRTPGFAVTAALVVALGVGANTAAFSVADFVMLRPLPFPESQRLIKLWEKLPGYGRMELSPANFRDWKAMNESFEAIGGYTNRSFNLTGQGEPERLEGAAVTSDLLPLIGVQPALGRFFTAEEDADGAAGTVILSHGAWQSRYRGESGVLGQQVQLDDVPYTIIGVMPRDFSFPRREVALWTTTRFSAGNYEDRNDNWLYAVGRLKPGVSLSDARAEFDVITAQLQKQFPKENEGHGATLIGLREEFSTQARLLLLALCGASLCILFIACANLASLLLARATSRQKELALRTALGAGRERLVRQLLTESGTLALMGGLLGVLIAVLAMPLLANLIPKTLPITQDPALDLRALLFAGVITALTGIGFGVVPALRACRDTDLESLREGTRSFGARKQRLRSTLVVIEVMASVVLLISAGLLLRALWQVQAVNVGFQTENLLTLRTWLPFPKYESTTRRLQFYDRVLTELKAIPGVSNAAYISFLPMVMGGGIWPVIFDGESETREGDNTASMRFATSEIFATLGIPLRLGRGFEATDTLESPFVAVVSESMVRRYWPDKNPLGQVFTFGQEERMVVGVVGDIMVRGPERESEPQVYLPAAQVKDNWLPFYMPKDLAVRTSANAAALMPSIRRIMQSADPTQPISNVQTMEQIIADQSGSRRVQARLLVALAAIAFGLAGVGIHGLLSYTVSNRTQEIGVRVALGAQPNDIVSMVMGQGIRLVLAGLIPGLLLAYAAGKAMGALLVNVHPADGSTLVAVAGLCVVMATAGCLFPSLRALRVDPISAIRSE